MGDARGGKGLLLPFSLPSLRLGGTRALENTAATCMQNSMDIARVTSVPHACARWAAQKRVLGAAAKVSGNCNKKEAGKGECKTNVEHVAWACGSGRHVGMLLMRRQ